QCGARGLFCPARNRDQRTKCVAGRLRSLFAGDAPGMDAKPGPPGRNRVGSGTRRPCRVREVWGRRGEVVAHNGAARRVAREGRTIDCECFSVAGTERILTLARQECETGLVSKLVRWTGRAAIPRLPASRDNMVRPLGLESRTT